jgi:PTS system nitrogen regulatory IIA component
MVSDCRDGDARKIAGTTEEHRQYARRRRKGGANAAPQCSLRSLYVGGLRMNADLTRKLLRLALSDKHRKQAMEPTMETQGGVDLVATAPRASCASRWLEPEAVVLDADLRDRRHALEVAADAIASLHGIDAAPVFRALWRREQVGSTALGHGFAIPHARIPGIVRPLTLFLRAGDAIPFAAPDGKPVSNVLAFAVPADGRSEEHLELLARVAEMLSDRRFRTRLADACTVENVRAVFRTWATRNMCSH